MIDGSSKSPSVGCWLLSQPSCLPLLLLFLLLLLLLLNHFSSSSQLLKSEATRVPARLRQQEAATASKTHPTPISSSSSSSSYVLFTVISFYAYRSWYIQHGQFILNVSVVKVSVVFIWSACSYKIYFPPPVKKTHVKGTNTHNRSGRLVAVLGWMCVLWEESGRGSSYHLRPLILPLKIPTSSYSSSSSTNFSTSSSSFYHLNIF